MKVLLLVLGLCFVGAILLVVGAATWVYQNKDELKAGVERIHDEGQRFGEGTDQDGCLAEATRRVRAECGAIGPVCETKISMFLRVCLDYAAPVDGFCNGVPSSSDIVESTSWAIRECGLGDSASGSRCTRQMQTKQRFCEGGEP